MSSMHRILAGLLALPLLLAAQTLPRAVTDPGVVVTRQTISPAGIQSVFEGRVFGLTFGDSASDLWVLGAGRAFHLDWRANRLLHSVPLGATPGLQGIVFDRASGRPLVTCATKDDARLVAIENGSTKVVADRLGAFLTGALAVQASPAAGRRLALVPVIANNKLAVVDLSTGRLLGHAPTGIAPFAAVISSDGASAFVSNWGGRLASPADLTAPTGLAPNADRVVIDKRGIASTATLTRLDLSTLRATATIPVGLHPTAMAWDQPHQRLYVAAGNQDAVSVIDTRSNRLLQSFPVEPFGKRVAGVAPTALALDASGARLYVACGGINAIAVLSTAEGRVEGLIPTGWYPNSLALSPDGQYLAVGTLLGVGSGWRDEPRKRFVHSYRGTASVIPIPDAAQLAAYTLAVAGNNRLPLGAVQPSTPAWPYPIDHVVYIIKENRTYDQVFGDIPKGNGDPSLVMFGEDVTPNQHRLAGQFVLLDNFYASGGNSGDGHQWVTQANETDYAMWPGWAGRSYPFDGTDPIASSANGFLWDYALRAGKTVRIFGEYAPRTTERGTTRAALFERWKKGDDFAHDWNTTSPIPPLDAHLARSFPGYSTGIPDVIRARIFLADLARWERQGSMPNLVTMLLPSNHTRGTTPGVHTPKAMVADNDLALGQIVESLTHSRFWPKMAIFVVEDDAQNGVDHVDGHRTVALAISPYVRRGYLDSTFYAHPSMVKTIELILGLPTMSLFDLIASDMRAAFTSHPDYTPYTAVEPRQSLYELNPPLQSLRGPARRAALASMKMRFDIPDAAPSERLNRILWAQVRGWNVPYPTVRRAAFAPLSLDLDDDDR